MSLNFEVKNSPDFIKLNAAFFTVEPGRGLTSQQLCSLLNKTSDTQEYELMTIEGEDLTAYGLIDMAWLDSELDFNLNKIHRFVEKIVNGVYDDSENNVYYLKNSPIYISHPDVY